MREIGLLILAILLTSCEPIGPGQTPCRNTGECEPGYMCAIVRNPPWGNKEYGRCIQNEYFKRKRMREK